MEGWGRYPRQESEAVYCARPERLATILQQRGDLIARGMGRSYGDAAIGLRSTVMCGDLNRMKGFDDVSGLLTVEGGTTLASVLHTFTPRGYFPPVVPGTKFVTIGGMIASDVHGKNHHRDGGFGAHLKDFRLVLPSGDVVTCSRDENSELFFATIGGMGLTGIIADATFKMKRIETGWIARQTTVARNLDEALAALRSAENATYSVAWIDCLSRGASLGRALIYAGEHATVDEVAGLRGAESFPSSKAAAFGVPVDLPALTLNRATVGLFNALYYGAGRREAGRTSLVPWDPFFFPLDGIVGWNRLYGKRGFLQHQCVVPEENAGAVLRSILERFASLGKGSFLAVLKKLGPGTGLLSFPMPGYTLALDLPTTPSVFRLLDEIDRLVVEAGGRLYLAKDARQSPATFEMGYPALGAFKSLRRATGADRRFNSYLAARLGI
jgi:FAD/FMN-containing dehydrogenase